MTRRRSTGSRSFVPEPIHCLPIHHRPFPSPCRIAPPSSSQSCSPVDPASPFSASLHPGGLSGRMLVERARAPVRAVRGQRLEIVPASPGKVGGRERLPIEPVRRGRAARDGGYGTFRSAVAFSPASDLPAPAKPVRRRGSASTCTMPGLRSPVCPVEVDDAELPQRSGRKRHSGRDAVAGTLAAWQAKQAEGNHAPRPTARRRVSRRRFRSESMLSSRRSRPGAPGHLAPLKEVGHLHSPLPGPRSHTRRADWIEPHRWNSRGGHWPPECACRWPRRRNDLLVRDHVAVSDLRRIRRPSTGRP